jgi:hypothetical protein
LQSYLKFGAFGSDQTHHPGEGSEHADTQAADVSDATPSHLHPQHGAAHDSMQPYHVPHPDLLI